ncbi:MAG: insulinase family protein [Bacteroidota bacterium]
MLDRTLAPPVQPLEPAVLLSPERYTLAGVPVFVFKAGEQPVIKVEWVFQAGKTRESAPGAAFLVAQLIKGGTASQTVRDIAEKLAQYGASLAVTPHLDYTSYTLTTLTKFADELIPWVTSLFWEATFPAEEVERQRAKKEQAIKIDLEKTSYQATVELRKAVFGNRHAYGRPLVLEEVQSLTVSELKAHHTQYHRNGLQVFLSGQVSETVSDCTSSKTKGRP